jgi:hypothetical protein
MKSLLGCLCALLVVVGVIPSSVAATPVVVAQASPPHDPQQPQLAIDAQGVIHVAFGANNDVRYARSEDGGKTFSSPVNLDTVRVLSLGMRRGPRIAVSGDAVCISVIGGKQGKGRDGDILLFRSPNQGRTWEAPVVVNDVPDSAREGLHAMAAGPQGELTCAWLDLRNRKTEIFASTSVDGGKTWAKNVLVYRSPSGSVCECCHPSVTYAPNGVLHVMWRNSMSGQRDMYYATSRDGGKTFNPAEKLGAGSWSLDHCPMDGGSLAVLADGQVATTWRRDKTVYFYANKQTKEEELGPGEQPWIATTNSGPVVVWLRKRKGALLLREPGSATPVELAQAAGDPVIAVGGPKNDMVIAAWEDNSGSGRSIVCQRIDH